MYNTYHTYCIPLKWLPNSLAAESSELAELVISEERRFEANPLNLATIRPAGGLGPPGPSGDLGFSWGSIRGTYGERMGKIYGTTWKIREHVGRSWIKSTWHEGVYSENHRLETWSIYWRVSGDQGFLEAPWYHHKIWYDCLNKLNMLHCSSKKWDDDGPFG